MLPIKLELTNFKSHAHSVIDMGFSSAIVVGERTGDPRRSNGSGKSSILEGISFALYGETGDKNADDVVKKGCVVCEATLDFSHDDLNYQIKRTRNAKYSKMVTEFWRINSDGSKEKLHGDTNKITDQLITDTIKCSYDVFLNSVYFRQGSFFDFAQGTFTTRQALLGSLLNLDDWVKYQKAAKAKYDKFESEIEGLRHQLLLSEKSEQELAEAEVTLKNLTAAVAQMQVDSESLVLEISSLESMLSTVGANSVPYQIKQVTDSLAWSRKEVLRIEELKRNYDSSLIELSSSLSSARANLLNKTERLTALRTELTDYDQAVVSADIVRMESAILDGKARLRQLNSQIEVLTSSDNCAACGHEWDDPVTKLSEIDEKRAEVDKVSAKLQRAEQKFYAVKNQFDLNRVRATELDGLPAHIDQIKDSIDTLSLRVGSAVSQKSSAEEQLLLLSKTMAEKELQLKTLVESQETDTSVSVADKLLDRRKALADIRARQMPASMQIGHLTAQSDNLRKQVSMRAGQLAALSECAKNATIYGKLTKVFGRDGIQAIIIDNVVDELTRTTNQWLSEFSSEPMHISFVTQKQGSKGEWKETFDIDINTRGGIQPWHSLSGGEKFIVSFAIRLAIGQVQAKRMGGETQLLLLDEVSSSLDPYNIDVFVSIIRKLEKTMKVLVITHDPALKDQFETVITVRRTAAGSEVIFE